MEGIQQRAVDEICTRIRQQLVALERHVEDQRSHQAGPPLAQAYAGMRRSCRAIRDAAADLDQLLGSF